MVEFGADTQADADNQARLCMAQLKKQAQPPAMKLYKAEFLSHYYEGRLRPRHAYSMGWIYWWARLAAHLPALANFFGQTPILRDAAKWIAGVAPERRLPRFAHETFKDWFRRRPHAPVDGPPVILWPDTFTNHFHPEIARAGVEVLEAAGFTVRVPGQVHVLRPAAL